MTRKEAIEYAADVYYAELRRIRREYDEAIAIAKALPDDDVSFTAKPVTEESSK
jgi:hypothetical protein